MLEHLAAISARLSRIPGLTLDRFDLAAGGAAVLTLAETGAPVTAVVALREHLEDGADVQYAPAPFGLRAPGTLELHGVLPLDTPGPGHRVLFVAGLRSAHVERITHPTVRGGLSEQQVIALLGADVEDGPQMIEREAAVAASRTRALARRVTT